MSKKTTTSKTPKTASAKVPAKKRTKAAANVAVPAPEANVAAVDATTPALDANVANPEAQVTPAAEAGSEAATPPAAPKAAKAKKEPKPKLSGLDAAAQVLADKGEPMSCKTIVETMLAQGLWQTNGKTPAATLYSAILREIDGKPGEARFVKTSRGLFALAVPKA